MRDLYPVICDSHVFIFATPVYWYGPTALLKAFIDRFVYFNCPANRPLVRGKNVAVAIVLEEETEPTWRPVLEFFEKSLAWLEMPLAGTIVVPGVGPKGAIREKPDDLERGYQLGRRLVAV
jgi:multimeric flavodoxin WrbA